MRYIIYLFALVLMSNVSCTITQKYQFNEDLSGKTSVNIDMSALSALAGEEAEDGEDPIGSALEDEELADALAQLENVDGISNVNMLQDDDNGIIEISYQFANMEVLNTGVAGTDIMAKDAGGSEGHAYWTRNKSGKKLSYRIPNMADAPGMEDLDMSSMEGMDDMFKYELVMEFAKPVKKIKKNSDATLSSDKKTIRWSSTLTKMMNGEATPNMDIKF